MHRKQVFHISFLSVLLLVVPTAAADLVYEPTSLAALGTVDRPETWELIREPNGQVIRNEAGTSWARFRLLGSIAEYDISTYLVHKAVELHLPVNVREVEPEQVRRNGVEFIRYIHGTVPLDRPPGPEEPATGESLTTLQELDSENQPAGTSARYIMVVLYQKGNRIFELHAETVEVPEDVLILNGFQRSWRPGR